MVWRSFAAKLETVGTMEGVALNMRAPYFYPTSNPIEIAIVERKKLLVMPKKDNLGGERQWWRIGWLLPL